MPGENIPNSGDPKNLRFKLLCKKVIGCSKMAKKRRFTRIYARLVKEELSQKSRRGFFCVTAANAVDEQSLINAIRKSVHVQSIEHMDMLQCALSAQVLRAKHIRDKAMDDEIDFDTQYVKLKLHSNATMNIIQTEEIERPDYYQDNIEQQAGTQIEDEDLIKVKDQMKYVLLRGRAGIGKSTLMQRLLWKWANGEWATKFKAIFLLNLRYFSTIKETVDFLFMLNTYSLYRTGRSDRNVSNNWLEDNEIDIAFVLDGVDEVDFTEFEMGNQESETMRTPLHWCFALMRRDMHQKSTLIVSSRPFTGLGRIARYLKEKALSNTLQLVQLVGLTRERVHEFVLRNIKEGRRDFVWQTLVKNPILMSISSITFYCAALCKILGEWEEKPVELSTYTQITSFIMKSFIRRSMQKTESPLKEEKVLQYLGKLAFGGLVRDIGRGPLRLVFDSDDIESLRTEKDITSLMLKSGLLMQTEIPDPKDKDSCTVLNQFVHLLIQEFLAMAGLLACNAQEFRNVLNKLGETQQFRMAIVFLYGLAFNSENDMIKQIFLPTCSEKEWKDKQDILMEYTKNLSELEAVQVAQESQSIDVARAVGQCHFSNGCHFKNTKLTVIDILAVNFVLKHNPPICTLKLERTDLDVVSVKELTKFLKSENTVEEIVLLDDTLNDACMEEIMSAMKPDETLKPIELSTNALTNDGIKSIATAESTNKVLTTLYISSNNVTDKGIQVMADALSMSNTLRSLRIVFRSATDKGVMSLAGMLKKNNTLKELWMIEPKMTDSGVTALGQAIGNSIDSLRIDCSNMTDEGVMRLADSLVQNTSLVKLWLHSHKITDKAVEYLMSRLSQVNIPREVSLFGFCMKDDGVNAILNSVVTAPDLAIRMWQPKASTDLIQLLRNSSRITFM